VADVNTAGLCGYTDWRMPKVDELQSIADMGRVNPAIDTGYFPSTRTYFFLSTAAVDSDYTWSVYFYYGDDSWDTKSTNGSVRLVRGQ